MPGEQGYGRFNYIAEKLIETGEAIVEIVTSDFSHGEKKHRENKIVDKSVGYKFTMLKEPGYKKNVSVKRFFSHYVFSKRVKKYLTDRKVPDVIYCASPSLDVAMVASRYAKKKRVRFIVDIQDLWPEAFQMVFNIPVLKDIVFYPLRLQANYIYKNADQIVAVSQTYVNRALKVNKKCSGAVVFLGNDIEAFDKNVVGKYLEYKNPDELWLGYCGTLGTSYDIECVIDALKFLSNSGCKPPKFIVMGDGPYKERFELYVKKERVDAEFTGWLPYSQMCDLLCACDIAVNPIVGTSVASIINKHGDYAAAGIPVINTQTSLEYRALVEEYNMGFNCENGNAEEIAGQIRVLMSDKELCKKMGLNARKCALEKFNRNEIYKIVIKTILEY